MEFFIGHYTATTTAFHGKLQIVLSLKQVGVKLNNFLSNFPFASKE